MNSRRLMDFPVPRTTLSSGRISHFEIEDCAVAHTKRVAAHVRWVKSGHQLIVLGCPLMRHPLSEVCPALTASTTMRMAWMTTGALSIKSGRGARADGGRVETGRSRAVAEGGAAIGCACGRALPSVFWRPSTGAATPGRANASRSRCRTPCAQCYRREAPRRA